MLLQFPLEGSPPSTSSGLWFNKCVTQPSNLRIGHQAVTRRTGFFSLILTLQTSKGISSDIPGVILTRWCKSLQAFFSLLKPAASFFKRFLSCSRPALRYQPLVAVHIKVLGLLTKTYIWPGLVNLDAKEAILVVRCALSACSTMWVLRSTIMELQALNK